MERQLELGPSAWRVVQVAQLAPPGTTPKPRISKADAARPEHGWAQGCPDRTVRGRRVGRKAIRRARGRPVADLLAVAKDFPLRPTLRAQVVPEG